jgi:hypothetical protein
VYVKNVKVTVAYKKKNFDFHILTSVCFDILTPYLLCG